MEKTSSDTLMEPELMPALKEQRQKKNTPFGMMKAIRIHEYGGLEKLIYEDVRIPDIGPDEVLIKVNASGINPIDWKVREGQLKEMVTHKFPLIPGWDVEGIIADYGVLVTRFAKNDAVFASLDISRNGSYAEYVVVKSKDVAFAPGILPQSAAGVALAAQTAWMGLFEEGRLKPNQRILIRGASGGVGTFAVQLAKIAGAYVIGSTSEVNIELVKSLGADEVLDYKKDDFSKLRNLDMIFDTVGGETQTHLWQLLNRGGMLISTVGISGNEASGYGVTGKAFKMIPSGARLQDIAGLIDRGALRVIIEKIFPFSEAGKAQKLSQSGKTRGKIILEVQKRQANDRKKH